MTHIEERTLHPGSSVEAEKIGLVLAQVQINPDDCPSVVALIKNGVTDAQALFQAEIDDLMARSDRK